MYSYVDSVHKIQWSMFDEEPHALHEVIEIAGFIDRINSTKENSLHQEKKFCILWE